MSTTEKPIKPNPFARNNLQRTNPFAKKSIDELHQDIDAQPVVAKSEPVKVEEATAPVVEQQVVVEATEPAVEANVAAHVTDAKENVWVDVTPSETTEIQTTNSQEAPVAETMPVAEAAEEAITNTEDVETTNTIENTEAPKEEIKTRKRRSKNTVETPEEVTCPDNTLIDTKLDRANVQEALQMFAPMIIDDEWKQIIVNAQESIAQISIDGDMNFATVKQALANIDKARESLWRLNVTVKTTYDNISSKEPEGLIERVRRTNSIGTNEDERKKNGIYACCNYYDINTKKYVNLYEVLEYLRYYYNFVRGALAQLESKQNLLITMSSMLKIESSLTVPEN